MTRLLIILMSASFVVACCGVGFLAYQGFNVLSGRLWTTAVEGLRTQPQVMIDAALAWQDDGLVSGLLAAIGGMASAVIFLALLNVFLFVKLVISSLKSASARRKGRVSVAKDGTTKPRKSSSKGKAPLKLKGALKNLPKLRLPGRGPGGFKDGSANLEGGSSAPKPSILDLLRDRFRKGKKPKTNQVVIGDGANRKVIAEITEDTAFYADLKDWHSRIKGAPGGDPVLVSEARALQERMTRAVTEKVLEDDPMNGEFLMLMAKAWAEKDRAETKAPADHDARPMREEDRIMDAAISEVMENGIADEGDDEEGIDFDDEGAGFLGLDQFREELDEEDEEGDAEASPEDMLDFDPTEDRSVDLDDEDDEEEASFLGIAGMMEGEEEVEENSAEKAPDDETEDGSMEELESAARAIYELKTLAANVADGMDEWPENLQSTADRVEQLEAAFMSVSEIVDTVDEEKFAGWLKENAGAPEWEWLEAHSGALSDERQAILEAIVDDEEGEEEDDSDAEGLDDFSVTSRSFGGGEAEPEEAEQPETSDPSEAHQETNNDEADADVIEPEKVEQEDAPEVQAPAEEEAASGQDMSLDQLDEVEACGDLLTKWGYSARSAGASEAKLVHTLVSKIGPRRKVSGIVHMVAGWKSNNGEQTSRLNLVFRYVPEGKWTLSVDGGIRLVDERENFIEVRSDVLEHPEVKSQTVVIHFHGPGVDEDLFEEVSEKVFVVGRPLSEEEIGSMIQG